MSKKTLILHFGAQKTGTKSLQKFLCYNSKTLKEKYNIVYPVKELHPEMETFPIIVWGHHLIDNFFKNPNNPEGGELSIKAYKNLVTLINSLNKTQFLLLSCEDFLINPNYKQLIDFFKNYFDEIVGIVYIRRQDESAPALYSTVVSVYDLGKSFQEWFDKNKRLFDYYQLIKNYESCGVKFVVRLYDKKFLKKQNIIADFLDCLSLIMGETIDIDIFPELEIQENVTFPDFVTMALQFFNLKRLSKIKPHVKNLGREILSYFDNLPKYDFISPEEKNKIIELYKHNNVLLCKEYFNNDQEILDLLTLPKYTETDIVNWNARCGYDGWYWYEFFKYIDELVRKKYVNKILPGKPKTENICSSLIEEINIDQLNFDAIKNKMTIGGIILLKSEVNETFRLFVEDEKGLREVQWGIPSPVFATKYPDNPYAKNARFKVESLTLGKDKPLRFYLRNENGDMILIYELSLF